jgi:hypothetical protein
MHEQYFNKRLERVIAQKILLQDIREASLDFYIKPHLNPIDINPVKNERYFVWENATQNSYHYCEST